MEHLVHTIEEMNVFAAKEIALICAEKEQRESIGATVIGLSGELGAGKTTFVQSLARALGITESVTSPTFVIARFYPIPHHEQFARLVHIDAYRIEDVAELGPIGWDEIIADSENLLLVEWPEKIANRMPPRTYMVALETVGETVRRITTK
jgi:tRNA threonylcarbamoyladenosine biosynthesis protein TsaE